MRSLAVLSLALVVPPLAAPAQAQVGATVAFLAPERASPRLEAARREVMAVFRGDDWVVFDLGSEADRMPAEVLRCPAEAARRCAPSAVGLLDVDIVAVVELHEGGHRLDVVLYGGRGVGYRASRAVGTYEGALTFAAAEAGRDAAAEVTRVVGGAVPQAGGASPAALPEPSRPALRREPHVLNYILGGLLLAGSVPLLGYAINSAVRDGQCVTSFVEGTCSQRIRFGQGAGIFLATGIVTLTGGLVFLIARPIQMSVEVGPGYGALRARGRF
ncbi:MAG: hypothetical protein ACFCGT_27545 [Sandaracinaceae bacterium]